MLPRVIGGGAGAWGSFDDFVGEGEKLRRDLYSKQFRCAYVDDQLERRWLLDW
jgi:hypothetical protein